MICLIVVFIIELIILMILLNSDMQGLTPFVDLVIIGTMIFTIIKLYMYLENNKKD